MKRTILGVTIGGACILSMAFLYQLMTTGFVSATPIVAVPSIPRVEFQPEILEPQEESKPESQEAVPFTPPAAPVTPPEATKKLPLKVSEQEEQDVPRQEHCVQRELVQGGGLVTICETN